MYSFKNYYSILNVSETAPHDEIKAAFRRMAKLYSPDVNPDPSVTHRFEEILEAWGVLGDAVSRREYDRSRGVWDLMEENSPYSVGRRPDPVRPSAAPSSPSPSVDPIERVKVDQAGDLGHTPRRWVPHGRERDGKAGEYFERSKVPLLVLGSLFLLWLSGWLRLESLSDGRGVLKAFLQGIIWGPFFWLSFWGIRFRLPALGAGRKLGVLYSCLSGAPYAFCARWFLRDVREPALPLGVDWLLWYASFVVIFAAFAVLLEPKDSESSM